MTEDNTELLLEIGTKAFEAELQRSERLTGKAEKYLGAIALVIGFGWIRLEDVFTSAPHSLNATGIWSAGASFLALFLSFLLALLSLRTRDYQSYPDGEAFAAGLAKFQDGPAANVTVAKMYFAAQKHNSQVNAGRSTLLIWCGYLLVAGFLLTVTARMMTL